jgi:hypothetical protein
MILHKRDDNFGYIVFQNNNIWILITPLVQNVSSNYFLVISYHARLKEHLSPGLQK